MFYYTVAIIGVLVIVYVVMENHANGGKLIDLFIEVEEIEIIESENENDLYC